jgi:hypothetical protein
LTEYGINKEEYNTLLQDHLKVVKNELNVNSILFLRIDEDIAHPRTGSTIPLSTFLPARIIVYFIMLCNFTQFQFIFFQSKDGSCNIGYRERRKREKQKKDKHDKGICFHKDTNYSPNVKKSCIILYHACRYIYCLRKAYIMYLRPNRFKYILYSMSAAIPFASRRNKAN